MRHTVRLSLRETAPRFIAALTVLLPLAFGAACGGCVSDDRDQSTGTRPAPGRGATTTPLPAKDGDRVSVGHLPQLRITTFGDVRPEDPDAPYPTARVAALYAAAATEPAPDLLLFLGDIIYVSPAREDGARAQLARYQDARASFPGTVYHAVGNHEAFGGNLTAFRALVQRATYYELDADTDAGEAKVIVVADNLYDDTQAAWLRAVLARPTAITVVVRHYPLANREYRNAEIAAVVQAARPTLVLSGHTHGFRTPGGNEIVAGIGGAPPARSDDMIGLVRLSLGDDHRFHGAATALDGTVVESFDVR